MCGRYCPCLVGLHRKRVRGLGTKKPTIGGICRSVSGGPIRRLDAVMAGGVGERLQPLTLRRSRPGVSFGGTLRVIETHTG